MNEPLRHCQCLFLYQGTRDSGHPDYVTMAQFLNDTAGDGFNGDTMGSIPEDFYRYSVDNFGRPIALEPEGGGDLESMNWDTMGWGFVMHILSSVATGGFKTFNFENRKENV